LGTLLSGVVLTPASLGLSEGGLLLYGGFDNEKNVLSDCWRLDLSSGKDFIKSQMQWCGSVYLNYGPGSSLLAIYRSGSRLF